MGITGTQGRDGKAAKKERKGIQGKALVFNVIPPTLAGK